MQRIALVLGLTLALAACGESSEKAKTSEAAQPKAAPTETAKSTEIVDKVKADVDAAAEVAEEKLEAAAGAMEEKAESASKAVEAKTEQLSNAAQEAAAKAQTQMAQSVAYEEGKHYEVLKTPVRTITPGKIEVTEVFAYSCGHCFHFESLVNPWKKSLPDHVQLVKSPAVWNKSMEPHARMHFAASALNLQEAIGAAAFNAIHREGNPLKTQEAIAKLFVQHGVSEDKFNEVYNSFTVSSQVNQANARARSMQITATPEMVVDGRFRISTRFEGVSSQSDMLKVANFLTAQVHNGKL